ncbi:MAG TPA: GNAT family N-acetyltransferase [Gemmatimonadales bacterium]|nr:GNAT family N-acetyltransferase [Gemmatimonadales bacterium]
MQIVHDPAGHRFAAELPSGTAVLAYAPAGEAVVDFYSTYVPPSERGRGVAGRLVDAGLAWARAEGLQVIPTCWFVAQWIKAHPEHADLQA